MADSNGGTQQESAYELVEALCHLYASLRKLVLQMFGLGSLGFRWQLSQEGNPCVCLAKKAAFGEADMGR